MGSERAHHPKPESVPTATSERRIDVPPTLGECVTREIAGSLATHIVEIEQDRPVVTMGPPTTITQFGGAVTECVT
jgi:hypothetical protein